MDSCFRRNDGLGGVIEGPGEGAPRRLSGFDERQRDIVPPRPTAVIMDGKPDPKFRQSGTGPARRQSFTIGWIEKRNEWTTAYFRTEEPR